MEEISLKPVFWIGTSLEDLRRFPEAVKNEVGFILHHVQQGFGHRNIKPLKGFDGVFEIITAYMGDAYRTVYALKIGDEVFVLHAFQKKAKKGIATPKKEIDMIKRRLKEAQAIADELRK